MKTILPQTTISYNSEQFLVDTLERLIKNKKLIKLTGNAEIPVKAEDAIFEDRGFSSGEVLSLTGLK